MKNRNSLGAVAAMTVGLLLCATASAHHSFAMFDGKKLAVLRGTMLSFTYMNPHSWISVMVPPGTEVPEGRWDVEATSPNTLAEQGIQPSTLKAGDKVTVGIRPLRDGRHGGSMVFLVDARGKVHGAKPELFGLKPEDLKPK